MKEDWSTYNLMSKPLNPLASLLQRNVYLMQEHIKHVDRGCL